MLFDDDLPRPKPRLLTPAILDPLGVDELREYLNALRVEVAQAEAEIARKEAVRGAADAVFGRAPDGV